MRQARPPSAPGPNGVPYKFYKNAPDVLSTYLEKNKYIDTSIEKAGIPVFCGCLDHTSMIWHQIQAAKDKRDLFVIFIFNFFHIPSSITMLVNAYFKDLQLILLSSWGMSSWNEEALALQQINHLGVRLQHQ